MASLPAREEYRPLLQENPVFASLSPSAYARVLENATLATYATDVFLTHQGDPAHAFYILTYGRAKLLQAAPEGQQVLLRYIVAGQEFGIIAALGAYQYPLSVQAVEPCGALIWPGARLADLIRRYPQIGLNGLEVMVMRNQELQRRYQELLTTRVEQRLAQALVRLAEQIGRPQTGGILIDIPLTRADLAEYTGTTLFSVSRILRTWETQGLVESGRERVVVRDSAALAELSDLDGVSFMGCALACGR
ncbi:MAG: Crp/Fnr family transcriptional regulator [Caldilineaceae bacterium]|nr:Crp/Fnr family transcriptional regulator [Caldilineaceae bacterium]